MDFSYPLLYIYHSLPHLTSKNLQKQAFKRTSLMFDINYPDQKVLCIANLIRSDVRGLTLERFKTF